jgi:hypothetical protein
MRSVRRVHEGNQMTKEEALKAMMLLSALESWAFSTKTLLPDYMHEDMQSMLDVLSKIVLEKKP